MKEQNNKSKTTINYCLMKLTITKFTATILLYSIPAFPFPVRTPTTLREAAAQAAADRERQPKRAQRKLPMGKSNGQKKMTPMKAKHPPPAKKLTKEEQDDLHLTGVNGLLALDGKKEAAEAAEAAVQASSLREFVKFVDTQRVKFRPMLKKLKKTIRFNKSTEVKNFSSRKIIVFNQNEMSEVQNSSAVTSPYRAYLATQAYRNLNKLWDAELPIRMDGKEGAV
jgi:hypothetical protein